MMWFKDQEKQNHVKIYHNKAIAREEVSRAGRSFGGLSFVILPSAKISDKKSLPKWKK